jgi:uncharacterized protein YegL
MKGDKIQQLNFAIREMVQDLQSWEEDQERAQVLIRAIAFANEPIWHVREPVPAERLQWSNLTVVPEGLTFMGPAFQMAASVLGPGQLPDRAFNPVLLLVTDGRPTDERDGFDVGLEAIMSQRAGRNALRMAVAIGSDARSEALNKFIANPEIPILVASEPNQIADRIRLVTLTVTGARSFSRAPYESGREIDDPNVPI